MKLGVVPVVCIGEQLEEREAGKTFEVIEGQLRKALAGITPGSGKDMVVAYEPVWAIGTGKAATGEQSNGTIGIIRSHIAKLYDDALAQEMRILYGGSVTADNIAEFMQQPEIDGALVGGASLKADQFLSIVRQTSKIWRHLSGELRGNFTS